jgi:alcohol dehydrogenase
MAMRFYSIKKYMKAFNFHMPTKIIFGKNKIREISSIIPQKYKRVFIVTDKHLSKNTDILARLIRGLDDFEVRLFDDVEENPSFETINKGAGIAKTYEADLIIGIGGGSCMDAAKGIAVTLANQEPIEKYLDSLCKVKSALPIVCIPTSSGTGSEVTPFAVFTDKKNENKVGFAHPTIFPQIAILDPELTYSMPREVIINTGLDALSHAVEAYLSLDSFEMNDQIALQCIKMVSENLFLAALKQSDAMDNMAYASMLGGIAITHASTILPHIMGYPLTVYHNVPHGRACIILLPSFLKYLSDNNLMQRKLHEIDKIFEPYKGLRSFLAGLTVSTKLSSYGVTKDEIPNYVEKTIVKGDVKITPGNIDREVITQLYLDSL